MATPSAGTGSVPTPGGEIVADPLASRLNALYAFLDEASNIDEANVDLTGADGIVGKSTAQTITGAKTFTTVPIVSAATDIRRTVYNDSGGSLAAGDYVYVSGWNSANSVWAVKKAVVTNANATTLYARFIANEAIGNGATGSVCTERALTGLNTSTLTLGRPVYLSNTAGGYVTALSSLPDTDYRVQIVGYVAEVHASTGRIDQVIDAKIPYSLAWDI